MKLESYLDYDSAVAQALDTGLPVVALESTIIFHGMPYPKNMECHERCEKNVREAGAVPATIGIKGGRIKIGLTLSEIDEMRTSSHVIKVSRRDFAQVVAAGLDGATTVAATMMAAEMAHIPVFATGGIGGVHRGAETSFDISADLQQLAQSNVCVVCAGAKSILDIGLTLEYLETMGVPVLGYMTDAFPAFYTPDSGFKVDYAMDTPEAVALMMRTKWDLGISGGLLVGCPIEPTFAMDPHVIDKAIEDALLEAREKGIRGKQTTPFLLGRVVETTGGASLEANMNLVWNNCKKAAAIACAYARI